MATNKEVSSDIMKNLIKYLSVTIAIIVVGYLLKLVDVSFIRAIGTAIVDNMAVIIAMALSVAIAEENNGVSAIAAVVGYLVLTKVAIAIGNKLNMVSIIGVLIGAITGIVAGLLYNKFKDIKVPQFLGFFGGKRFVPIITSFIALIAGLILGYL